MSMVGKRLSIDGRPATIVREWEDAERDGSRVFVIRGYDYRHDDSGKVHWIVAGSPRMTELQP